MKFPPLADKILVTPFRQMVVPPPMSAYTIQLPKPVNQVCFAPPPHSNNMAALMNDGRIAYYKDFKGTQNYHFDIKKTYVGH